MYKLEIYDSGVYSFEEHFELEEAKWRMLELGANAHEKLLLANTPDLRLIMKDEEYAIIGKHQNVWFSARMIK